VTDIDLRSLFRSSVFIITDRDSGAPDIWISSHSAERHFIRDQSEDGSKEPFVLRRRRLPDHVRHVRRPRAHRLQPHEPPLLGVQAGEITDDEFIHFFPYIDCSYFRAHLGRGGGLVVIRQRFGFLLRRSEFDSPWLLNISVVLY